MVVCVLCVFFSLYQALGSDDHPDGLKHFFWIYFGACTLFLKVSIHPSLTMEKDNTPGNFVQKRATEKTMLFSVHGPIIPLIGGLFSPICRAILRAIYRGSVCQSNHRKPSMKIRTLDLWRPIFKNINCTLWNKAHRKPKDYLKKIVLFNGGGGGVYYVQLWGLKVWKKQHKPMKWTDLISFKMHSKLD